MYSSDLVAPESLCRHFMSPSGIKNLRATVRPCAWGLIRWVVVAIAPGGPPARSAAPSPVFALAAAAGGEPTRGLASRVMPRISPQVAGSELLPPSAGIGLVTAALVPEVFVRRSMP